MTQHFTIKVSNSLLAIQISWIPHSQTGKEPNLVKSVPRKWHDYRKLAWIMFFAVCNFSQSNSLRFSVVLFLLILKSYNMNLTTHANPLFLNKYKVVKDKIY